MTAPVAYGAATRNSTTKRILDVERAGSREDAELQVAQQNERLRNWTVGIEWVVVEIRAIEPD